MKNFFQKPSRLIAAAVVVGTLIFSFVPALAQTSVEQTRCDYFAKLFNFKSTTGGTDSLINGLPKFCSATQLVLWATQLLLVLAGTVSVLFIVIGGFFYLSSAGNDEQAEKGKKILINSVIGLVVIIMAGTIVRLIASSLTLNFTSSLWFPYYG